MPTVRVMEKLITAAYSGSRYAERLSIGLIPIIENATQSVLKGFYKKWYRPDNMAVILVGDFDDAALEKALASYFQAVAPKTTFQRPNYEFLLPKKGNQNIEIITDSELTNSYVYLCYGQSVKSLNNTIGSFRENLIDVLISSIINQRFKEESNNPDAPYINACIEEDRVKGFIAVTSFDDSFVSKNRKNRRSYQSFIKRKRTYLPLWLD
jgi:zinc protease